MRRIMCAALAAASILLPLPALASQGSGCIPTTGTLPGLTAVQDINAAIAALISSNAGASAPTTDCSGLSVTGQLWLNTAVSPNAIEMYNSGTGTWVVIGTLGDGTNMVFTPPVGGGVSTIASAATTDLGTVPAAAVTVTGTTAITALGATAPIGTAKFVTFQSAGLVLTYNATSLILPTAANITTQAGDKAIALALGSGNWALFAYTRADGTALNQSGVITGALTLNGTISPPTLSGGDSNNFAPSGFATAVNLRLVANTSGSTITGISGGTDGRTISIRNAGNAPITFTSNDSNSSSGNRFLMSSALTLFSAQEAIFRYDATAGFWYYVGARTCQFYQNIQYTSSGTYTPPSNLCSDKITVVGAGGAGGAAGATGSNQFSAGGGGGGGGCAIGSFTAATIGSSAISVTVGAAGSGSGGTSGGASSFGTLLAANGGNVGSPGTAGSTTYGQGGAGGTASGGLENFVGTPGQSGTVLNPAAGGNSCLGGGAQATGSIPLSGLNATGPGGGGSGGINTPSSGQNNGGNGFRGEVDMEEWRTQ